MRANDDVVVADDCRQEADGYDDGKRREAGSDKCQPQDIRFARSPIAVKERCGPPWFSFELSLACCLAGKFFLQRFDFLGYNRRRKCAATSISAVWGNISMGVTDSFVNFSPNSLRSRASVEGLHET